MKIFMDVLTLTRAAAAVSYQGLEPFIEADFHDGERNSVFSADVNLTNENCPEVSQSVNS
jgi:hypothetical protein